jgi:hypothetical protein
MNEVLEVTQGWEALANKLQISNAEIELMRAAFIKPEC